MSDVSVYVKGARVCVCTRTPDVEKNDVFFPVKLNPITNWFFYMENIFFISFNFECIKFLFANIMNIIQAQYTTVRAGVKKVSRSTMEVQKRTKISTRGIPAQIDLAVTPTIFDFFHVICSRAS